MPSRELIDYFLESLIADIRYEFDKQTNLDMTFEEYAIYRLNAISKKLVEET